MHSRLSIGFSRFKHYGWEVGLIDGIGKVLCFKAEGVVLVVNLSRFSSQSPIEKVASIELDSRLCGADFHDPP